MQLNKKGKMDTSMKIIVGILCVVVIGSLVALLMNKTGVTIVEKNNDDDDDGGAIQTNIGEGATLSLKGYTGSWGEAGAKAEVSPTYTVLKHKKDGTKEIIINDATTNSTTDLSVGDTYDVYCTGASFYCEPRLNQKVVDATPSISIEVYQLPATTGLVISGYNSDEVALTADDGTNNTADYAGGDVLANDNEKYYFKVEQTTADRTFPLFGICTYAIGDEADDFKMDESGWTEISVALPKAIRDVKINGTDDTDVSTIEKGYTHCYERSDGKPLMLHENDATGKMEFLFESDDTTQPAANGDTYFGLAIMDGGYSVDVDGEIAFGFFMDDDTEDPGAVGLDENPDTTWNGLDVEVQVEPQ